MAIFFRWPQGVLGQQIVLLFWARGRIKKKAIRTIKIRIAANMLEIRFWAPRLAEETRKSSKDENAKLCGLTAKTILKFLFSTRRWILRKNQTALLKREKVQKGLKFDHGCTIWQSTSQNLPNINTQRFLGWTQETSGKKQKLY